jgi:hypothetical protein
MAHLGYHNSYQGGFFDAYVAKLSPAGNRIWGVLILAAIKVITERN